MRQGGVLELRFRWIAVYGGCIFLASVFLLLLAGIISTLNVFGKSYIDFSG